ncbi:serine/threonine-protein kinase [Natronobacillus azotifigens]|uniref:Serine/threonine-protein kinase PrkC n=1 Tax=Natronobacillus azotifigens TaxID=472978 RepID=A0A9J6RCZ8_9BACI|nr:Stk1 family PASTA domain-containing Ser/Thr kinase [Natronobacillus azotifigens]MCZ0703381.1 Stk1 family PASTA domain-containing Ser/Thr kinase [Natronobacillus azotifigens]
MIEGRLLNDRYEVKKIIGGGGMANVYLGHDIILDREVAIKVLRLEYSNDEEFITRFHREAQSATSLSHPNIVNIFDVGDEDGIYYMVMEYVEGMTLKKYIQLYGPIQVEDSVAIMEQITSAIAHAHANNIVHRDIKPQNILIDPHGQVKVTDFGIALALSATALTQTNSVLGSVHYLSPEQARGGVANKKSDIYSLGIVLFELLTGRIPFSGQSAVSIALKHLQSNTPSLRKWIPEIPQSLENVVLKATTKDPFHRYESVESFENDLVTALDSNRINEAAYIPPEDQGEQTKAIPVLTKESLEQEKVGDDTIVHSKQGNEAHKINNQNPQVKKKQKKKKSLKAKILIWTSVVLFILIGASLFAIFVLPNMFQPNDVSVPDLTDELYEDAEQILNELELDVVREDTFSDEIDAGNVVRTNPTANTVVREGSTVIVYVSSGPETEEFPDYVGQNYSQVERLLLQRGYQDVEYVGKYSDQPEGQIIAQNEPEPGTEVVPADTIVIFEVSIGTESVTLDDLTGMDEISAREYLTDNNLVANVTEEHSSDVEEGYVIRHSPSSNAEVEVGAVVDLVISLGQEEQPPITHTVSFSVPYTGAISNGNDDEDDEEDIDAPNPYQEVRIYIEDMNNELTDLYEAESIQSDTTFRIRLVIAPGSTATYKVERDDQVILQETIAYQDIEGE